MNLSKVRKSIHNQYGSIKGLYYYSVDSFLFRLGVYKHSLPDARKVGRVVFVCHGNICRSALAVAVFKQYSSVNATSLGLDTTTGNPANDRLAKIALDTASIDLSNHRTTSLKDYEREGNDLFVCMELGQLRQLRRLGFDNPALLLGECGERKLFRINDPYSANDHYLRKTVNDIVYHSKELALALKR